MSYTEYKDLYEKAQEKKSDKIAIIIDVMNSKYNPTYYEERMNIIKMMEEITNGGYFEIITDNKLLFTNYKKFVILGDLFGITIKANDSMNNIMEKYLSIIKTMKEKYSIHVNFHYNSCYYETDDWAEGNEKYYSGYAIQQLEADKNKENII